MNASSTNPGCLTAIKRFFGFGKGSTPKPSKFTVTDIPADHEPETFPYRQRDDFLSPAEHSFYMVLKDMMGSYLTICPKVSLADIFFVVRPNENMSAYNRINRKHVDFLLCEPSTMKPRFAIELDDSSHQRADREERDDFVDAVFKAADLPLLHIPVRASYNTNELGLLLKQILQKDAISSTTPKNLVVSTGIPETPSSPVTPQIPYCPKCGVTMILRTTKTGPRAGQQFYGCPNFPKCREIIAC